MHVNIGLSRFLSFVCARTYVRTITVLLGRHLAYITVLICDVDPSTLCHVLYQERVFCRAYHQQNEINLLTLKYIGLYRKHCPCGRGEGNYLFVEGKVLSRVISPPRVKKNELNWKVGI